MAIAIAAAAVLFLLVPLDRDASVVVAILALAMVLWIGEALPLGVTALASSLLLVAWLGADAKTVFAAHFDPVIVLLLGGFLLGVALHKHGLDAVLATATLRRVGSKPSIVLLAVMGLTAVFSMWISNTATTVIMLPIAVSLIGTTPRAGRGRAFVLGVAAAANIGGIATPIGTTANPIALRFLAEAGHEVSFLGWVVRATPLAAALVVVAWAIIVFFHEIGDDVLQPPREAPRLARPHWMLMTLFGTTVLLWFTTPWHGQPPELIALGAGIALFVVGLLTANDLAKVSWDVLLLIGGSIALGQAVQAVGLDAVIADRLAVAGEHGPLLGFLAVAVVGVTLTLVTSNTAAAVLLVPLSLQWAPAWGVAPLALVMTAAISVSFDFVVPVGTPPNAMARATNLVDVRGMMRSGVPITVAAVLVLVLVARFLW